jgi:hypothetical protein
MSERKLSQRFPDALTAQNRDHVLAESLCRLCGW